ncbi:hypothetical protein NPIL_699001, partial [Nephila pilipes]
MNIGGRM